MTEGLHYNADEAAAYPADKAAVQAAFALAAGNNQPIRHIDITCAFVHERYPTERNESMGPITRSL